MSLRRDIWYRHNIKKTQKIPIYSTLMSRVGLNFFENCTSFIIYKWRLCELFMLRFVCSYLIMTHFLIIQSPKISNKLHVNLLRLRLPAGGNLSPGLVLVNEFDKWLTKCGKCWKQVSLCEIKYFKNGKATIWLIFKLAAYYILSLQNTLLHCYTGVKIWVGSLYVKFLSDIWVI